MEKLVSVIIPNFNKAAYLHACIESCLSQGDCLKEIIIVDDHSTDQSWNIFTKYKSDFPNIVKIFKNSGKGACSARNFAILKSTGKYLQFLDSDDILGVGKIEKQLENLEQFEEDYVSVCKTIYFYDNENHLNSTSEIGESYFLESSNKPDFFLARLYGGVNGIGSMIAQSAWLTPAKVIKKAGYWNENLQKDQDGEFFARVLLKSKGIVFTTEVINYYRKFRKTASIANNRSYESSRSLLEALHLKREHLFSYSDLPESRKGIARLYLEASTLFFSEYKDLSAEAERHYMELDPAAPVPVIGGPILEWMKLIFGWKRTLKMKAIIKKYI